MGTEGQCLAVSICIAPNDSYDVKELSRKFMWNLKPSQIEKGKDYALQCTFKYADEAEASDVNAVKLKIQFEIQDSGISTVHMKADEEQNEAKIVHTVKGIRSGEFILR